MAEAVILIHGLGRTHWSLKRLEKRLQKQGFVTYNQSYPSTKQKVSRSAEDYISNALNSIDAKQFDKVHFVTHSLGGILVRYYLSNHHIENLGRILMLAPPNHGSEVADKFKDKWWYKMATGPTGQQLTESSPLYEQLEPLDTDVGIIIGNRSSDPWFNHLFDGEHDGKVSVASAKLKEDHQLQVVNCGHTLLMESNAVMELIIKFLKSGELKKAS
ncbi:MAG: alpha/beta hydrolase [Gammaproteobacteria bacterium]|nr:alpha/beta hydrolase [Gammaproteobacteria bacterium]